jgi:soluble lytic murein transglycosylase-like protein
MTFPYRAEVEVIASRHGLTPDLVQAVCMVESAGKTDAYRFSASYGLMQVMFTTAVEHGMAPTEPPEYLFVPIIGLDWGCRILAKRIAWAKGDLRKALASYNGGKGNWTAAAPQRYADKVLAELSKLQADRLAT